MNEHEQAGQIPPLLNRTLDRHSFLYWARRLLDCNPFYLISAACLLYGSYQFTINPAFRGAELGPITTIFSSLQLYEILVVVTAIILAKRQIWYDSTLLVAMENMFVLIPFILVTLAVFLGNTVTWIVCGMGAAMAIIRFSSLKRFIPSLNMPRSLLGIGLSVLATNLVLPFIFRSIHGAHLGELHKADLDTLSAYSRYCWLLLLPLLFGLVNFLRRPAQWGGVAAQQSWLPLGFATIWIVVSAVHFWCIGYIYDLFWGYSLLAPLAWIALWTLHNRLTDFDPNPPKEWGVTLLALPALTALLGAWDGTTQIVLALAAMNTVIYGSLYFRQRKSRLLFHLLLISLTTLVATMPEGLGRILIHDYSRNECVFVAVIGYVILRSVLSRHPLLALRGAVAVVLAANELLHRVPNHSQFAIQFGLAFALMHSMTWQEGQHSGAPALRIIVALGWILHSFSWLHDGNPTAVWCISLLATFVLGSYFATRFIWQYWASRIVPAAALAVLMLVPIRSISTSTTHLPAGLLAVLLAFLLFVLGTLLALTRDKWSSQPRSL